MQASTIGRPINSLQGDHQLKGVVYERVHPSTRCIIQAFFAPPKRGETFIRRLLTNATIKPFVIPGQSGEAKGKAASVKVTEGCKGLKKLLDLSYDTTHMYLVIYRALGII